MKIQSYFASSVASTVSQNLDRWQTFSTLTDTTYSTVGQNVQQMSSLLQPTATITVAITTGAVSIATANTLVAIPQNGTLLLNGAYYTLTTAAIPAGTTGAVAGSVVYPIPAASVTATAANAFLVTSQGLQCTASVYSNNLDDVTIQAHGINIYDTFPTGFFNRYTTYHYGGPNINTPDDNGLVFIPFCLYPGTYQPSGHINVSRAREFYLNYDSSTISSGNIGTLVVIASAINFLLISDGSAVLRYST